MPNWIEGTMKLRGKMTDVKRFFDEGLDASAWFGTGRPEDLPKQRVYKGNVENGWIEYEFHDEPHVKGTHRMFITDDYVYMDEEDTMCCFNIKQAWGFAGDDGEQANLINIADTYHLDIKLYGIECGMQFCQEVVVLHGKDGNRGRIVSNNEIKYDDWGWECPFPRMGG